jgi:hypothetical protein
MRELWDDALIVESRSDGEAPALDLSPSGCDVFEKLIGARRVRLEELALDWPEDRRAEVAARLRELATQVVPPRRAA